MSFKFSGRIRSFKYAFEGILFVIKSQYNAWIHLFFTVFVLALGFYCNLSKQDWIFIIISIAIVWIAEILNTAFELLCDITQPDFHPIVKKAKDVAAGAVLISAISAVIIGILVFKQYLLTS